MRSRFNTRRQQKRPSRSTFSSLISRITGSRIEPYLAPLRPLWSLSDRVMQAASLFYDLRHKPRILLFWLKTSARSHIVFIAAVVLLCVGLSLLNSAILRQFHSEKSLTEKFTGMLGSKSRSDRQRESAEHVFNIFLCFIGVGMVGSRMLLDLHSAIGQCARTSRAHEEDGDALRERDPRRSVVLYRLAEALACYPERTVSLREKIRAADKELAARMTPSAKTIRSSPSTVTENSRCVGDRYEIRRELGRGASGTVYRAEDVVLDRSVALKELLLTVADDDTRARFRREAKILARLNHPNIVQVYDLVEHGGRVWIAMELVSGGDLAALLERKQRIRPAAAARLGEQIAGALAFAHEQGVIHRDLKPLNILLVDDKTPKVTDFGLAKLSEGNSNTVEGAVFGSPVYMSPEQADGKPANARSDIYSLGIMLYQMLTGRPPFEGDTRSVLMQHIRRPVTPLRKAAPDSPTALARTIMKMLAKEPDSRPANMTAVARQLRNAREDLLSRV